MKVFAIWFVIKQLFENPGTAVPILLIGLTVFVVYAYARRDHHAERNRQYEQKAKQR